VITIKTAAEIAKMREAGKIAAGALAKVRELMVPGVTTRSLDRAARAFIEKHGAEPSFLGYKGFPASITVSVNNEVIHGVPGERKLLNGDIVAVDVGAYKNGYHGDICRTFPVGKVAPETQRLLDVTKESFYQGLKFARAGCRLYEISGAIQQYAEGAGFSVVREYIGHGVGRKLHEAPDVPNYKPKGRGPKLAPGMTLAIEPMVNEGGAEVRILNDAWTVITVDGKLSAHYENTVLITAGEPELLTILDD
jgi:methionyl aminopeptidase